MQTCVHQFINICTALEWIAIRIPKSKDGEWAVPQIENLYSGKLQISLAALDCRGTSLCPPGNGALPATGLPHLGRGTDTQGGGSRRRGETPSVGRGKRRRNRLLHSWDGEVGRDGVRRGKRAREAGSEPWRRDDGRIRERGQRTSSGPNSCVRFFVG